MAKSIESFSIIGKLPESDHRPLVLSIVVRADAGCKDISPLTDGNNHYQYRWSHSDLNAIKNVLKDIKSNQYHNHIVDALVCQLGTNTLAHAMNQFMSQALDRVCVTKSSNPKRQTKGPCWYDRELRGLRSAAVKAGEQAAKSGDHTLAVEQCRAYRTTKQRKER